MLPQARSLTVAFRNQHHVCGRAYVCFLVDKQTWLWQMETVDGILIQVCSNFALEKIQSRSAFVGHFHHILTPSSSSSFAFGVICWCKGCTYASSFDAGGFNSLQCHPSMANSDKCATGEGYGEEQYISFCFQYVFAGANHQTGFSLPLARYWLV